MPEVDKVRNILNQKWTKNGFLKRPKNPKSKIDSHFYRSSMPEVDEIRNILESGDITALFSLEELRECPRLSSSLVNLPTYLHCDEPLPDEVINALSRNKAAHKLIQEHFPNSLLARNIDEEKFKENEDLPIKNVVKLKRKVSSLFKAKQDKTLRPILKKPVIENEVKFEIEQSPNLGNLPNPPPSYYLNHLRVRKQSLTYRGAMLSIPRYRLRASSCPDIYRNSMTTIAAIEVESDTCCQRTISGNLKTVINRYKNGILYS